jgi:hypothetical protein
MLLLVLLTGRAAVSDTVLKLEARFLYSGGQMVPADSHEYNHRSDGAAPLIQGEVHLLLGRECMLCCYCSLD